MQKKCLLEKGKLLEKQKLPFRDGPPLRLEVMKLLKKTLGSQVYSFEVQELRQSHFDSSWHFHPHYQLFTVFDGSGTRFIVDDIRDTC